MKTESNQSDRSNGRWTREEHQKFLLGLELYGKNWKKIEELVVTRNGSQIRSHAQKYFLKNSANRSHLQCSNENQDPHQPIAANEKNSIKSNNLVNQIIGSNSSFFWTQISFLLHKKPEFTFWKLIDYPSECQEKQGKKRKLSEQISEQSQDRMLRNITKSCQSTMNEGKGFNIFSPLQTIHQNY